MPQIIVRQISDEVHHALKARAKQQNKSAEALAREILESSLLSETSLGFGHRLAAIWAGADLTDVDLTAGRVPYEPIDLS